MNKQRRTQLEEAIQLLEEIKDGEEEAYENLPENFQNGEKGEQMQEVISALDSAISELQGVQ